MFGRGAVSHSVLSITLGVAVLSAGSARAQQAPADGAAAPADVENSKYQIVGVVNANAVYIRSSASDNAFPTMKLDKGAEVTVVGEKFDWLKIQPPEGSYCLVAKAYVNRSGNGSVGIVTSTLNVHMGSALNPVKPTVSKLDPNARVEIIGEADEYFKIKPPADVAVFIKKEFVDPVRQLTAPPAVDSANDTPGTGAGTTQSPTMTQTPAAGTPLTNANTNITPGNAGQTTPAMTQTDRTVAIAPSTQESPGAGSATTQPVATAADAEFERLEVMYDEASRQPLDKQPVDEMLSGYQKLSASDALAESMRRICDFKISVLKVRQANQAEVAAATKINDDLQTRQMALHAEQQELQQRVDASKVEFYTAVGTLRPSSLQGGSQTLYRLTDPSNGRTVIYLRSDDAKISQHLGEFVGVKGEVATDSQMGLRVISATACQKVSPGQIGQGIAAQIVPPSLLPGGTGTASSE